MENKEKIEKLFCILRQNSDNLILGNNSIDYKSSNITINLISYNQFTPQEIVPVKLFGVTISYKEVKKSYHSKIGKLYSYIDGYCFETKVDIEMFDELYSEIKAEKEAKFQQSLKNLCDEK